MCPAAGSLLLGLHQPGLLQEVHPGWHRVPPKQKIWETEITFEYCPRQASVSQVHVWGEIRRDVTQSLVEHTLATPHQSPALYSPGLPRQQSRPRQWNLPRNRASTRNCAIAPQSTLWTRHSCREGNVRVNVFRPHSGVRTWGHIIRALKSIVQCPPTSAPLAKSTRKISIVKHSSGCPDLETPANMT